MTSDMELEDRKGLSDSNGGTDLSERKTQRIGLETGDFDVQVLAGTFE